MESALKLLTPNSSEDMVEAQPNDQFAKLAKEGEDFVSLATKSKGFGFKMLGTADSVVHNPDIALPDLMLSSTGEENETKVFGERVHLYSFIKESKEWTLNGVGEITILHHSKLNSYRLLMCLEEVHKLVVNMKIDATFTLKYMYGQKNLAWASPNYAEGADGVLQYLACRFSKVDTAENFYQTIMKCIKDAKDSTPKMEGPPEETGN